ncbi:PAS and ANTAR domain-containing protein [Nocardia sp. CDC159]|uniref:PAS and ANTAR domain-containing protein n=1 Tax=Nocardia pulmonis TaxID=2951408 RepID=A0A9X2E5G2_9NOCA|nr:MULTISPECIES: PAS and ANTAR domain-containing protein [Nocardia]MCM6774154.1 PAS and ANTAR domain-containing protein [Nocardia pulmonis]MCM6787041.1 PAS and ANTAR domain-containing protein [Nocardia sp. CDC159]
MIDGEKLEPQLVSVLGSVIGNEPCANAGEFRFRFADRRWEWSDELARLHGYEPGTVEPTTELLLSHQHPEDRASVQTLIERIVEASEPFCSRHRIIDADGDTHEVIVIADYDTAEDGTVIGTTGYYIELTGILAEQRNDVIDEIIPDMIEARAPIEQAKGILSLVYELDADQAFAVLKWRSQHTNVKIRDLAAQLVHDVRHLEPNRAGLRMRFDHVLLTVHERVAVQ